jgi:hypothetical protein
LKAKKEESSHRTVSLAISKGEFREIQRRRF